MGIFSCLGSICDKVCGSCSVGTFCNCSKTQTIIIADGNTVPHFLDTINQGGRIDLHEILQRAHPTLERETSLHDSFKTDFRQIKVYMDDEEYEQRSVAAIYLIAMRAIGESMKSSGDYACSWKRFESAYQQANVNLLERFNARRPISPEEFNALYKKIDDINQYGSFAADLLEKICACRGEWSMLDRREAPFSRGLIRYLSQNLSPELFQRKVYCSELDLPTQEILIQAVKKYYPKDYLQCHKGYFRPWAKERDSTASLLDVQRHVPDSPPRAMELGVYKDSQCQRSRFEHQLEVRVSDLENTENATPRD